MEPDRVPGGTLTVAAVPIGDPGDASPRLTAALAAATLIAAEDTRRVRRLAAALRIPLSARLVSYYDDVEARRVPALLAELQGGNDILMVTDAGLPGVSDPGYRLVAAASDAGLPVTVLPGPSAVTAALVVSGLPTDRFLNVNWAMGNSSGIRSGLSVSRVMSPPSQITRSTVMAASAPGRPDSA